MFSSCCALVFEMFPWEILEKHCFSSKSLCDSVCVSCLGKLTDDVTEFVESWRENPPQGTHDWDKSLLNEPPCLTQSRESLQVWINTKGLLP